MDPPERGRKSKFLIRDRGTKYTGGLDDALGQLSPAQAGTGPPPRSTWGADAGIRVMMPLV
jgi:hypothetical protein